MGGEPGLHTEEGFGSGRYLAGDPFVELGGHYAKVAGKVGLAAAFGLKPSHKLLAEGFVAGWRWSRANHAKARGETSATGI